jgi:NADPH:quinone reductase-like Zn-dependent oxidoreductase
MGATDLDAVPRFQSGFSLEGSGVSDHGEKFVKAIVQDRYGAPDVLELRDVDAPAVTDDDVLVRVRAASVNPADWHIMRGRPRIARIIASRYFGLLKPKDRVRGSDVAGQVEAVGRNVKELRPGGEVFGWCRGAFAEYVSAGENNFVPKPMGITFEQAAAVPLAAVTALQALRDKGRIRPGQEVLVNGASGGVGTFAVQIAKSFGADVTGVCSTRNLELVRSIGADHAIDYTREDFTRSGQQYDLILDAASTHSVSDYNRALSPQGICVVVGSSSMSHLFRVMIAGSWASRTGRKRIGSMLAEPNKDDMVVLKELLAAGKVTPVIDRTFPLSEAPEAIGYLEAGHARGKVVIAVGRDNSPKEARVRGPAMLEGKGGS